MRKLFTVIFFLVGLSLSTYAQTMTPQQIYKLANRDAEKYVKAGWKPAAKMPSIDRQFNNAYLREMYDGKSQFIIGSSTRRGRIYQRVHSEAMNNARKDVLDKIESEVSSEIIIKIKSEESYTRQQIVANTISSARQKLRKTEPIVDIFRELKDGEVEVEVRIAYELLESNN